jgi:hypothetical protein
MTYNTTLDDVFKQLIVEWLEENEIPDILSRKS